MIKNAGIEESSLTDPRTNLKINISTTTRMKYRKYYSGQEGAGKSGYSRTNYSHVSNVELNDIIAQDFAKSSELAHHMFLARSSDINTGKRYWIEVRAVATTRPFNFFFSIIRENSIDVITVSTKYKIPRKPRTPIKSFHEA